MKTVRNIFVKDTNVGTITDVDGLYNLSVPDNASILVFSYVGYITKEVEIGDRSVINLTLTPDLSTLSEIVVIGYGQQKKVNVTGAVATVDTKELLNRPTTNALDALQGQMAGVNIQRVSGDPGNEALDIQVRGATSINNTSALIVIDGAPSDNITLARLNPQDIESISVLKDASAAAIYGARAAGGVVLVTTKKGKEGKIRVDVNSYYGIQNPMGLPEFWSGLEIAKGDNAARVQNGGNNRFTDEEIEKFRTQAAPDPLQNGWFYYENTDWVREALNENMAQQEHAVQISGGTENTTYLASFSFFNQEGILGHADDEFTRYNVRTNFDFKISDRIKLDTRLSFARGDKTSIPSRDESIWFWVYEMSPWMPVFAPESGTDAVNGAVRYSDNGWYVNPVQNQLEGGFRDDKSNIYTANATLTFDLLEGLTLTARGIINQTQEDFTTFNRTFGSWGRGSFVGFRNEPNNLTEGQSEENFSNLYSTLRYSKVFAERHDLTVLAGVSREENKFSSFNASRINLIDNDLPSLNLGSTDNIQNGASSTSWGLLSYFGRINYSFDGKYLFEFSFRRDGSSRFARDVRWGNFPSASVGWRLSEENFIRNLEIFDDLKLRASWGQLGNQNVADFAHLPLLSVTGQYPFGSDESPSLGQSVNEDVLAASTRTWETVEIQNVGVDAAFFQGRLNLTFDVFKKITSDVLIAVPQPGVLGIPAPPSNNADFESKGWELSLGYTGDIGGLKYSVRARLDDNTNEITRWEGNDVPTNGSNNIEGQPLGVYYGLSTI